MLATGSWSRAWRWARVGGLLALIPGLLGLVLVRWPVTSGLERTYGLDLLFKLRGKRIAPSEICVVAIDDASYIERGLDPLRPGPRDLHGELVTLLAERSARAVAFDVLFEGPGEPEKDLAFELGLFDAGIVVLGATVERVTDPRFRQARLIEPHPPFADAAAAVAEVELPPDTDGVIRETWLAPDKRPSLALAAYQVATGDASFDAEYETRLIDYYGPPRTIQTISLYQALDPDQYLPPDFFRDKIVFVGASQVAAVAVSEAKDSFPTPFTGGQVGLTYGVEIHATLAANLLDGSRIVRPSGVLEALLLIVLATAASLVFIFLRPLAGAAALVGFIVASPVIGFLRSHGSGCGFPSSFPSRFSFPQRTERVWSGTT